MEALCLLKGPTVSFAAAAAAVFAAVLSITEVVPFRAFLAHQRLCLGAGSMLLLIWVAEDILLVVWKLY